MSMQPRLPYGLHAYIVDSVSAPLTDDLKAWRNTLITCALVSKDFKHISYSRLFRSAAFVFVKDLNDKITMEFCPPDFQRRKPCYYRYVTTFEDIISLYLYGSAEIIPSIRRLSLHMDHNEDILDRKPPWSLSYDALIEIIRPLQNLQCLSLVGIRLGEEGPVTPPRSPLLPSLLELVVDYQLEEYSATVWHRSVFSLSPKELSFFLSLFGEIKHLVLLVVALQTDGIAHALRSTGPPIRTVTIWNYGRTMKCSHLPLQFISMQNLCALHLAYIDVNARMGTEPSSVVPLSRILPHIGPTLEHITIGTVCVITSASQRDNAWRSSTEIPGNLPNVNNFPPIDFSSCVRLHTVGITIQVSWRNDNHVDTIEPNGEWCLDPIYSDLLRIVQRVALQPLPPPVKILKLTIHEQNIPRSRPYLQRIPAAMFWETLEASLNALVDKGVERVEIVALDGLGTVSEANPCTES